MRYFLDDPELIEEVTYLYEGNDYAVALASILRAEERKRDQKSN
jgi:hypothetical protein